MVDGAFIARNAGEGPDFFTLSARVSRSFKLGSNVRMEGLAEAFNLTNRVNVTGLNANFGAGVYPANPSPAFRQMTAVGEPRTLQFAVRLRF